jgi:eukaryotic-like serine/threonine-protein kinase
MPRLPGLHRPHGDGETPARAAPDAWLRPVLFLLLLAAAATAGAIAASAASRSSTPTRGATRTHVTTGPRERPTSPATTSTPTHATTTAPEPTKTTAPTTTTAPTSTAPRPSASGLLEWPAGRSGYTVVLASIPSSSGRSAAVARAHDARRAGLPQVGVLLSSDFASLRPGYWVVFAGVYGSRGEAQTALGSAAVRGFPGAYPARVSRS